MCGVEVYSPGSHKKEKDQRKNTYPVVKTSRVSRENMSPRRYIILCTLINYISVLYGTFFFYIIKSNSIAVTFDI